VNTSHFELAGFPVADKRFFAGISILLQGSVVPDERPSIGLNQFCDVIGIPPGMWAL